jgi:adenylate kinase family enzyme
VEPVAPQRVLVYGVTGSGKSTLAARLSAQSGIPWHHVDDLTWEPGWIQVPVEEQRRRLAAIIAGDAWILDTAYAQWLDDVLPRVELIVGLDLPRLVSLARLLRRTAGRAHTKQPICNGNVETWRKALSRDSIIWWHFRTFAAKRRRFDEWEREGRPLVRLRSSREVERFSEAGLRLGLTL